MKKLIILGNGGTCLDIAEAAVASGIYHFLGFLDDNNKKLEKSSFKTLGPLSDFINYTDCYFINGIGSSRSFKNKREIINNLQLPIEKFATVIHPKSSISASATIAPGTAILSNVSIGSNVTIKSHNTILQNTVVGHDSVIESYCTIGANVCISGDVCISEQSYIGSGSNIRERIQIGQNSLIGIGSCVVKNIPRDEVWAGVPAKSILK